MYSLLSLVDLQTLLTTRGAVLPITAGVLCGVAYVMFRGTIARILVGGRDSRSLMNLSANGSLRCVCGAQHPEGVGADRRQYCRNCGCEVVAQNEAMLDRQLSPKEIKAMTRSLRVAAIRASQLELPPSITTVEELHRYLGSSQKKVVRSVTAKPAVIEQPTIH